MYPELFRITHIGHGPLILFIMYGQHPFMFSPFNLQCSSLLVEDDTFKSNMHNRLVCFTHYHVHICIDGSTFFFCITGYCLGQQSFNSNVHFLMCFQHPFIYRLVFRNDVYIGCDCYLFLKYVCTAHVLSGMIHFPLIEIPCTLRTPVINNLPDAMSVLAAFIYTFYVALYYHQQASSSLCAFVHGMCTRLLYVLVSIMIGEVIDSPN